MNETENRKLELELATRSAKSVGMSEEICGEEGPEE